ncbi:hypothetical protein [Streptomyces gardneri]|uniref:hypothetical protein n=1 Tax=Streptomyces gardneri TaxID=66892 RepID=UPI0035E3A6D8
MSDWGIALIAAGSAILGSITTGFFAWKAGHRQAAAAESAGQAQASALIATVQATLDEQRRARADDRRRQAHVELLSAGQAWQTSREPENGERMLIAFGLVQLEGPDSVVRAAQQYLGATNRAARSGDAHLDDAIEARVTYIEAVRRALNET